MNFCKMCQYWEETDAPNGGTIRICGHPDRLQYFAAVGAADIATSGQFGCVLHSVVTPGPAVPQVGE